MSNLAEGRDFEVFQPPALSPRLTDYEDPVGHGYSGPTESAWVCNRGVMRQGRWRFKGLAEKEPRRVQVNVRQLGGPWDLGYALDKHTISSVYTGDNEYGHPTFDTTRSEAGEALYQLKYRNDVRQVGSIANQLAASLSSAFKTASFIAPMPSSRKRTWQPVLRIARQLAANMEIPCLENVLLKSAQTGQMKDMGSKEDRINALSQVLYLNDILDAGLYDVLLVDDLLDTGASLEAATGVLRSYSKIRKIFVATVTRKR